MRFIPPHVLEQYPWITDVTDWLQSLNALWHEYQAFVILLGLALLWWLLRQERLRLGERIETLRQIVTAIRDQTEEALAAPSSEFPLSSAPSGSNGTVSNPAAGREFFEIIRQRWRDARDRIELAIEEIPRSRVRGKYGRLPRYDYSEVIVSLQKDSVLTPKERTELLRMNDTFNYLKFRPTKTTQQQATEFGELYAIGTRRLPDLP